MTMTYWFKYKSKTDHMKNYKVEADSLIDAVNKLYDKPSVAKILSIYVSTYIRLTPRNGGLENNHE